MTRKSFCDKCGKNCTFSEREYKCNGGTAYIWLKNGVAMDLLLCLDCKSLFELVVAEFVTKKKL